MKKVIFTLIFSLVISLFIPKVVDAQQPSKGVTATPSLAHIDLSVDAPEYKITYVNNFDTDITLKLSVKDFTELEDSYKLEFLDDKQSQNYKYSLSSWITLETKTVELSPGEKKSIKVFIDKNRITKGGHYASILAEISQPSNDKNIGVKAVLSSLLFVRASTGKEIEEGKIFSLDPLRDNFDYPNLFLLRFQNSGNVHVVPYGTLMIYDPLGNLAAKAVVNEDSLDALPESIRSYTLKTITYQKILLPGFYKAKLNLHFGKTNQKVSKDINYFSQGSFNFFKIGGLILAFIILLIIYRKNFRSTKNKKS